MAVSWSLWTLCGIQPSGFKSIEPCCGNQFVLWQPIYKLYHSKTRTVYFISSCGRIMILCIYYESTRVKGSHFIYLFFYYYCCCFGGPGD
jgi:hypothetical protein